MSPLSRQRGVALLAAILIVAIATVLAATIAFESAMSARRGAASLSFDESTLVAEAAEALAGYALREDNNKTDSFADTWANPLGPVEVTPGVTLEAALEDMQGRFNLNNLLYRDGVTVDQDALESLRRLCEATGVEPEWADKIVDWLDRDSQTVSASGLEDNGTTGQNPPYRTANTLITSTSELLALPEFGRERYLKIAPYLAALPPGTPLNVCTAAGIVLDAMVENGYREYGLDAKKLADNRKQGCFPVLQTYLTNLHNDRRGLTPPDYAAVDRHFADQSRYFRLTSVVTIGDNEFALYSLLQRPPQASGGTPGKVNVLQRSFTPD